MRSIILLMGEFILSCLAAFAMFQFLAGIWQILTQRELDISNDDDTLILHLGADTWAIIRQFLYRGAFITAVVGVIVWSNFYRHVS